MIEKAYLLKISTKKLKHNSLIINLNPIKLFIIAKNLE